MHEIVNQQVIQSPQRGITILGSCALQLLDHRRSGGFDVLSIPAHPTVDSHAIQLYLNPSARRLSLA
ncbi:MAG TPA: hypothetical protein VIJ34_14175 [Acidimicrobiales bacterium]